MLLYKKFVKSNTLRWFFFGIGMIAVVALTGMNVYSLVALRESTLEAAKDQKKYQLEEFTNQVRHRFRGPSWNISKLDIQAMNNRWMRDQRFPEDFQEVFTDILRDSLFSDLYFIPPETENCYTSKDFIYRFNPVTGAFTSPDHVPDTVCDGFGISSSQIKVMLDDLRWSTKTNFDAHRSMTVALINLDDHSLAGYLNFLIDRDYLINSYLKPEIESQFGPSEESGLVVWLRDWLQDEILTASDEKYLQKHDRDQVDILQPFPADLLENWSLHASFLESPAVAASDASLRRNLIVLGSAVFVLFGALVFMFINAQRERELAQRQAGFLANITHELKTPLAVMQAAGENISDGRVTDGTRLRNYGDHIYHESVRLRKMIEKLLDVAKADSGQTVVKQAPHRIESLVEEYCTANRNYVESNGFRFKFDVQNSLPMVMIDPDHLETIMNNLIENSIKYSSHEKEIRVNVYKENDAVAISVSDRGDGIPKQSQKHIFEKFYRGENSLTAKTKGHGLGLAIVKNMAELNGGSIRVSSQVNQGSTFTVLFPAFIKSGSSEILTKESKDRQRENSLKNLQFDEYVQ